MISKIKRIIPGTVTAGIILFFLASAAWAKKPVNTNWLGIAIKGYDPVAYFTEGKAVEGMKKYQHEWQDAKWRFASQAHLDLFRANPEKYAPQYGGY